MHHFLVGVFSRQISLCRNFHSKVGVGVISVEYGIIMLTIQFFYGILMLNNELFKCLPPYIHVQLTTSKRKHRQGQQRPVCESKLDTTIYSDCKSTLLEKKLSPRTVVVGTSSNVKFAITSSLNTSVPVQQVRRKESRSKLLKPQPRVSMNHQGKPSRRPLTQTQTSKSDLSYQDSIDDYNSVSGSSNTTFNKKTPLCDDYVASKSPSLDRSAAEHGHPASSAYLSRLLGPQQTICEDLSPTYKTTISNSIAADTHSSQPLSGALMLEVDMQFRSKETHVRIEHPSRDNLYTCSCVSSEICSSNGSSVESMKYMQLHDQSLESLPSSQESDNEGQSRPVMQYEQVHVCSNDVPVPEKNSLPSSPKVDSGSDIFCVESRQEGTTCNSTVERSSSTLEATEGCYFSIAGSISSFEQPLSIDQIPPPSLGKSAGEFSLSTSGGDTPVQPSLGKSAGEFSLSTSGGDTPVSVQPDSQVGSTIQSSLSPLSQNSRSTYLPVLLSNQKQVTSSWLQAINSVESKSSNATESDVHNVSGVSGEEVRQTVSVHSLADSDPSKPTYTFNQTVNITPAAIASGSGSLKYEDVINVNNDDEQITDDNIHVSSLLCGTCISVHCLFLGISCFLQLTGIYRRCTQHHWKYFNKTTKRNYGVSV